MSGSSGRVVVIGGGVSGLAVAHALQERGREVTVLEAADRCGGSISSLRRDGYVFEQGASSVGGGSEAFLEAVDALGMRSELLPSREDASARYLYQHGHLHPLPQGLRDFLTSPLFTRSEKIRVLAEPFVPVRANEREASVAEFFGRRVGRGATCTWVDVVVSSTFAGNPNRLGIRSAYPELLRIEQEEGGLVRSMWRRNRKLQRERKAGETSKLLSLRGGLQSLIDTYVERLGERVALRTRADRIEATEAGGFRVHGTDALGSVARWEADDLVLAVPPRATGRLLQGPVPEAADLLWEVETVDLAVVSAGFDREQLPGLPPGHGFLIPRSQRMRTLGWLFYSQSFPEHAPEGKVALMGVLGGSLDPKAAQLRDDQIRHVMLGELALCLHQVRLPVPEVFDIHRWQGVLPQYNVGHERRVQAVRMLVGERAPRLHLCGGWLEGITVDSCLRLARTVAEGMNNGVRS